MTRHPVGHDDAGNSGGQGRFEPVQRIFEYQSPGGSDAEALDRRGKQIRSRLGLGHIISAFGEFKEVTESQPFQMGLHPASWGT